jgi:predicted esterase
MNSVANSSRRPDLGFEHVFVPGAGNTTLLLLHSTGGDEHQLIGLGRQLAPEANLLSPRGKVLENGVALRFFRRHSPLELDIPDLKARTDELAEFVASAADVYGFDPAKVVALGYSNGANIAASLLLRRPGLLAGAALWRATLPYEPESVPALTGTRVLIASGTRDPFVVPGGYERLTEILRAGGAEVVLELASTGHELLPSDIEATQRWLAAGLAEVPR